MMILLNKEMIIFILVLVGLSLLVLGHEAGHFLCAKFSA